MHDTAMITGDAFLRCYGDGLEKPKILDVGSLNVNGTLKGCIPEGAVYTGIDIQDGPNVDFVLQSSYEFPFENNWFDLVISTSCFEHDPMFWLTFEEMSRVVKPGGFIYISAPANGPYHGYPGDCWRFYKDSTAALSQWAYKCGFHVDPVESFQMFPKADIWIDQVMVFGKRPFPGRQTVKNYVESLFRLNSN